MHRKKALKDLTRRIYFIFLVILPYSQRKSTVPASYIKSLNNEDVVFIINTKSFNLILSHNELREKSVNTFLFSSPLITILKNIGSEY